MVSSSMGIPLVALKDDLWSFLDVVAIGSDGERYIANGDLVKLLNDTKKMSLIHDERMAKTQELKFLRNRFQTDLKD